MTFVGSADNGAPSLQHLTGRVLAPWPKTSVPPAHSLWKSPTQAAVATRTAPDGVTEPDLSKQHSIWDSSAIPGQAAALHPPQQAADATWPTPAQAMVKAPSKRTADVGPPQQPKPSMHAADGTVTTSDPVLLSADTGSEQRINEVFNLWEQVVGADDQHTAPDDAAHAMQPITTDAATASSSEHEPADGLGHAASAPVSSTDVSLPDNLDSPRGSGSSWTAVPTRSSQVKSSFKPPVHHWPGFQAPGNADYKPFSDRQNRPVRTVLTKPPEAEVSSAALLHVAL